MHMRLFSNAVSLLRLLYLVFDILFEVTIFSSFKTVSTVIFRKEKKEKKLKKKKLKVVLIVT